MEPSRLAADVKAKALTFGFADCGIIPEMAGYGEKVREMARLVLECLPGGEGSSTGPA